MAKTNPIGVRFDEELLKIVKETAGVSSPQKALNLYEEHFRGKIGGGGSNTRSSYVEDKVEDKTKTDPLPPEDKKPEIPPMPIRGVGENVIDFVIRKNEWKAKYNQ